MALYNSRQRVFLQNILRKGVLSVQDALDLSVKCGEAMEDTKELKKFLISINKHLTKQSLSILITKCEISGEQFVVLNQNAYDSISKLQTGFQENELEYFHAILKEIVTSEEKALPYINCLNLSCSLARKLSRVGAEALLEQWVSMGYLILNDELIRLGVRGTTEFSSYFRTHCKDYIRTCCLCSELVFTGKTCVWCHQTMHLYCMEKYASEQLKCPNCKKNLETNDTELSQNNASESSDSDEEPPRRSKRKS